MELQSKSKANKEMYEPTQKAISKRSMSLENAQEDFTISTAFGKALSLAVIDLLYKSKRYCRTQHVIPIPKMALCSKVEITSV
ncbi:hypothetical protein ACN5OH_003578 [Cronobacter turicensis]|uniref:hypothetical protein n=1 Tax=Cronobacter turicensis TaxID=413502 RepID=UPI0029D859BB|nr:hypothetical protein [Cronobacter turicensis]ELY4574411.1 hypothetical protein [Cronobacter turicensis]